MNVTEWQNTIVFIIAVATSVLAVVSFVFKFGRQVAENSRLIKELIEKQEHILEKLEDFERDVNLNDRRLVILETKLGMASQSRKGSSDGPKKPNL